jgi:heme A synthase
VRWLGVAALAGVVLQGVLGGMRVLFNALWGPNLAFIHGCFAQAVFGLLAALVVLTAPAVLVENDDAESVRALDRFRLAALLMAGLTYAQIVLGGLIRHMTTPVGPRGHLLLAFATVAAAVWLFQRAEQVDRRALGLNLAFWSLVAVLVLQLFLGVESWMIRFGSPGLFELRQVTPAEGFVRTAHFLCGSLIWAFAVMICVRAELLCRRVRDFAAPEMEVSA